MYRVAPLLLFAVMGVTAALTSLPREAPAAYACSGAYPPLEQVAREAQAVVLAQAVAVRGPDYELVGMPDFTQPPFVVVPPDQWSLTPTATDTATPTATPTPLAAAAAIAAAVQSPTPSPAPTSTSTPLPLAARPTGFDLTGYGATMQVESLLLGSAPARFELDRERRRTMETQLRGQELRRLLLPCPVGFLVPRYEAGQRYLLFLRQGPEGWSTLPPYFVVDGENRVVIDHAVGGLWVGQAVFERFFGSVGGFRLTEDSDLAEALGPREHQWSLNEARIALPVFMEAVRLARGDPLLVTPADGAGPETRVPAIQPPSVGDGGVPRE